MHLVPLQVVGLGIRRTMQPGDTVVIHGLVHASHFNDRTGRLLHFDTERGRWCMVLCDLGGVTDTTARLMIKEKNVTANLRSKSTSVEEFAAFSQSRVQHRVHEKEATTIQMAALDLSKRIKHTTYV